MDSGFGPILLKINMAWNREVPLFHFLGLDAIQIKKMVVTAQPSLIHVRRKYNCICQPCRVGQLEPQSYLSLICCNHPPNCCCQFKVARFGQLWQSHHKFKDGQHHDQNSKPIINRGPMQILVLGLLLGFWVLRIFTIYMCVNYYTVLNLLSV